jgi:ABC-2 type transport system permease protein
MLGRVQPTVPSPRRVPPVALTVPASGDARARAQGSVRWELLVQLVRKDLKVKYQGSALGFAWSLANPLLLLGIYYLIFGIVLDNGVPAFPIYLMAGLLPFTAFSSAVTAASGTVVGNAGLVKKVRFPLQVLPLSAVGYAAVHFVLQMGVLLVIAAAFHREVLNAGLVLLVPALALLVLFATALAYLVAALNVRYRDTAHVVEVAMLMWFWLQPILYPLGFVKEALADRDLPLWPYFLNPMATVVTTFQRAIYAVPTYSGPDGTQQDALLDDGFAPYLVNLAIGFAIAGALFLFARSVFRRMQADFAEEL